VGLKWVFIKGIKNVYLTSGQPMNADCKPIFIYIYILSSKAGNTLPKQELYSLIIFEEKGWTDPRFLIFVRI